MLPNPGLLPYTKNNEPLPPGLIKPLNLYLGFLNQRIRELDKQIQGSHQQRQLWEIQRERERLLEVQSIYQALTAPSRRVPPEILASILREALAGPDGQKTLNREDRKFLKGLRSVCRLWRETAICTLEIW
ncbi:hypothetical protein BKA70DRAFT_728814 [Coprinopsis sp. MPI-PUGE-AT-0042]|nr:hypothetical protein BKA70DRAFT_728814 [Coprinopsis sp. MPI-PUGE-AT-0042]